MRERLTRRSLALTAIAITTIGILPPSARASVAGIPLHAGIDDAGFLALSQSLTGWQNLDAGLSARLLNAMTVNDASLATQLLAIRDLVRAGDTPGVILARAKAANLVKPALALVAAWYTGCVSESANAPIVAYDDALMYRPTRDALPVPTYCLGGPAWWTTDPPPLGIAVAAPAATL
jgi:hypothetical protein